MDSQVISFMTAVNNHQFRVEIIIDDADLVGLACEYSCLSSLFTPKDVSQEGSLFLSDRNSILMI